MKLSELKTRIDLIIQRQGNEDLEVCIPNNKGGMGGMSVTKVRHAGAGIDWDRDKFIIWPEAEMIEQPTK